MQKGTGSIFLIIGLLIIVILVAWVYSLWWKNGQSFQNLNPTKLIYSQNFPEKTSLPSSSTISNLHCGGNIKNAKTCPAGYHCQLNKIADTGGVCVQD